MKLLILTVTLLLINTTISLRSVSKDINLKSEIIQSNATLENNQVVNKLINKQISNLMKSEFKQQANISVKNYVPEANTEGVDTHIILKHEKSDAEIFEKVQFIIKNGFFTQLIHKISLGGTANKFTNFKLASRYDYFFNKKRC